MATMRRLTLLITAIVALFVLTSSGRSVFADEGWTIDSYAVDYKIEQSGLIRVTEDLQVDFGFLQKHGIFREMPVRYDYDEDNDRLISPGNIAVDDGEDGEIPFDLISSSANLRIKIGDPDKLISGKQRYRITYLLTGAMNHFPDHDEFYWNVTGNGWPVRILDATATVTLPGGRVTQSACYQGPADSTEQCSAEVEGNNATFSTTRELSEGEGITVVVGVPLGIVDVGPPVLVAKAKSETGQLLDMFDVNPYTIGASVALADVDASGWNLTGELVRSALSPRTRVVIAIDQFGSPADLPAVLAAAGSTHVGALEVRLHRAV
ncbi:MAG: DUF2207 domain-containing protein, partial [Chloroflexota bacterium]